MLWDLIRDFFVEHVFGGYSSNGYYDISLGEWSNEEVSWFIRTGDTQPNQNFYNGISITLGDWLSTTATIISITIIVVLCCLFIKQLVKLVGGLLR